MKRLLSTVLVALWAQVAGADSLSDRLMAQLLERNLPSPVYRQANNPWPGGSYSVEVFAAGEPEVTSSAEQVHLKTPLRIVLSGQASSGLLNLDASCRAEFTTDGELNLTPVQTHPVITLDSELTLPVPPVTADCGQMQLSVERYLRNLIAQNKGQWEKRINREINAWLTR